MANKKRKRKPLKANSQRQAHASLKGYLYQIWHSVHAWLDLADDDILYLEGAEDFDILSEDTTTATQVKHTRRKITLRSPEVIDAINHYWELQTNNLDRRVKFRFLTRSKIGIEQGNPFGKDKQGLALWQRCSGNEAAIRDLSEFLQTEGKVSEEVRDFLKQADPQEIYERLIEPITWETDGKPIGSVEQSIGEKLVTHGHKYEIPPSYANKVVDHLLKEALTVATQKENRELTKVRFLEIFEEKTTIRIPIQQHIQAQQLPDLTPILDHINAGLIENPPDITIQSQSPIQTEIPPLYRDVTSRADKVASIQTQLQSAGIAIIQGGTGRGKTTLAKLTANAIEGDWFWLNFTNKEPSVIEQHLRQLAIVVSNQSSQVNVVLDDLNLQPQQLRTYEEILSIVVYRILERGAKVLITSQYRPPNNLIRSLGVSKAIVIDVPNFTTSEIEEFAIVMECPTDDAETWTTLIQAHTRGHPRLVHAWLIQLREKGWTEQKILTSILQPPEEVVEERGAARQLLEDLPQDRREFLYRLSLLIEFRKDYALNIADAEMPEPISHPGDVFSQLVGPWIDRVDETYYAISPLLKDAAKQVWSENRIKDLHAYIANAILKTKKLTPIEAWTVFTHSMAGQNKEGIIAFIYSLMTAPQNDWKNICQEFSLLAHIKIDPPQELFPGNAFVNYCFRSLQYQIAVEMEPEFAPKILEIWDKETRPYEPYQLYLQSRLMLAVRALMYPQVLLPAKQMVGYLTEIIEITRKDKQIQEVYGNFMEQLGEYKTDKSNYFSILFRFVYARSPMYVPFLNDLIDALDGLDPKDRNLLLADFEEDTIDSRLLIDGIWLEEAQLNSPDWTRCLQVFDKVIEKTIEWGYPHIAVASARGKAIIHDEYLQHPNAAHKSLQDIASKVGILPGIEEEQAVVYLHQKRYKEALDIYERVLPKWNPPSEQLNIGPLDEYRRAAICAAHLGDWKKAATFLEEGAKRTQQIENTERYIGLYADAGFAHFKAGSMLDCIKLLYLALQNFELLPQDNTDLKYFTLKKRLVATIQWMALNKRENYASESEETPVGFCSNPDIDEKVLDLPDSPIEYAWQYLAQIEYKFRHGTSVLEHALRVTDRNAYPIAGFFLSFLKTQYDFRHKTFDQLPQRINQMANACSSIQRHNQNDNGIGKDGIASVDSAKLVNFTSIEHITVILVSALLAQLPIGDDRGKILDIWRANSSELSIKDNIFTALDLIESMVFGDENNALTVLKTQENKSEERIAAALKVMQNKETSPENLFYAHTFITTSIVDHTLLDSVVPYLAKRLSAQWLEKIQFRAALKMPMLTVPDIEQACTNSETGKKKIGQILLAAYQAVSIRVAPETLQQFRNWAESESDPEQQFTTGKNPIAQRLIKTMAKPPHLTNEDIEALNQSIKEGKIPIKFDSPFESDEPGNNE